MEPDAGLDPSKARDITFTVDASVNWKEKPISRKTQPKPQPQPREDADPDDVNGMEGWAVLFDPPEKNVRQARCSHEGVYAGDMQGWAQHNYIM